MNQEILGIYCSERNCTFPGTLETTSLKILAHIQPVGNNAVVSRSVPRFCTSLNQTLYADCQSSTSHLMIIACTPPMSGCHGSGIYLFPKAGVSLLHRTFCRLNVHPGPYHPLLAHTLDSQHHVILRPDYIGRSWAST